MTNLELNNNLLDGFNHKQFFRACPVLLRWESQRDRLPFRGKRQASKLVVPLSGG
jgi:hypothetical protein